jgi:hypothetical protein|tara:strand:+ start:178 stop:405 length:228 start_codon:yes stop_codon:yes gene_type:complete
MDKEKLKLIEQHIENIEHISALTWEEKVLWYFNSLGTYKQEADKDITILSDVHKQLTKEKISQINSKLEKKYHIK